MLMAAAAMAVAMGCKDQEAGPPGMQMEGRPPAMVAVAPAVAEDVPVYLEQIGRMVAIDSVTIVPQVGGKLDSVHFKDGAYVEKGELLFEIDPRPFEAALSLAKAELAQNRAMLELAEAELQRYSDAVSSAAVSEMEYEQKRNAVSTGQARVAASEAAVETAELDLEYTKIFSPIDGRAGARLVDPGNVVTANTTELLVIQQLSPIYAEFTVTEGDLGTIRKYLPTAGLDTPEALDGRLKVQVDVPADSARVITALGAGRLATQPADDASSRIGKLTFVDNSVNRETGTVRMRATLENADHHFWPGQFVNVRLLLDTKPNAVLVPAVAQQLGQQGPYVYVINQEDTAEMRPVVLGQRQGPNVVIQEGVKPGERVVVTGAATVMPSAKVTVIGGPGMQGPGMPGPGMQPPGMEGPGGPPPDGGPEVTMAKEDK